MEEQWNWSLCLFNFFFCTKATTNNIEAQTMPINRTSTIGIMPNTGANASTVNS